MIGMFTFCTHCAAETPLALVAALADTADPTSIGHIRFSQLGYSLVTLPVIVGHDLRQLAAIALEPNCMCCVESFLSPAFQEFVLHAG